MVVAADQLKDVAILLAFELVGFHRFHAALVHNPILRDERALAEILLRALEEHGPAPHVQKVSQALRVGLVVLMNVRQRMSGVERIKHCTMFAGQRAQTAMTMSFWERKK